MAVSLQFFLKLWQCTSDVLKRRFHPSLCRDKVGTTQSVSSNQQAIRAHSTPVCPVDQRSPTFRTRSFTLGNIFRSNLEGVPDKHGRRGRGGSSSRW